jgi:hypothetical protein
VVTAAPGERLGAVGRCEVDVVLDRERRECVAEGLEAGDVGGEGDVALPTERGERISKSFRAGLWRRTRAARRSGRRARRAWRGKRGGSFPQRQCKIQR